MLSNETLFAILGTNVDCIHPRMMSLQQLSNSADGKTPAKNANIGLHL